MAAGGNETFPTGGSCQGPSGRGSGRWPGQLELVLRSGNVLAGAAEEAKD